MATFLFYLALVLCLYFLSSRNSSLVERAKEEREEEVERLLLFKASLNPKDHEDLVVKDIKKYWEIEICQMKISNFISSIAHTSIEVIPIVFLMIGLFFNRVFGDSL